MSNTQSRSASFSLQMASGDALHPRHFTVEERMNGLFSARVTAVAESADLDFEAIIGQPARFSLVAVLEGSERRRAWSGVCSEVQEIAAEEAGLSTYSIEIVPTLWLATQRRNHRMFQRLSDVDIAVAMLREWGVEPVLRLSSTYPRREYRVQYGESDHDFIARLLEGAGVSWYFIDEGGESRLVLSDAPEANALREPRVRFRDRPGDADLEHVTACRMGRRIRPGRVTLRDHDARRPPSYPLLASAGAAGVEERLERFDYVPGAFVVESGWGEPTPVADDKGRFRADESEGAALAARRLASERAATLAITFETNVIDLAPGVVMGIAEHPRRDLGEDRRLLVVASRMRGVAGEAWKVEIEARRAEVLYRPPLVTPRPRADGVESATVVGPPDEEIHCDELGRVRVHFHWDRESRMNDQSSSWIHVSEPWAGAGYGGINLPRVGQEVLVGFLGGDPDRPVIVGRVYTALQTVPNPLPAAKTQGGLRSRSTKGTGGFNEIMFDDAAGAELVRLRAQRQLDEEVLSHRTMVVGGRRQGRVNEDDDLEVGGSRAVRVAGGSLVRVGGARRVEVGESVFEEVAANASRAIAGDERVAVGGDSTTAVRGRLSLGVEGDHAISVGNPGGHATSQVTVEGRHALFARQDLTLTSESAIVLSVGGSSLRIAPEGVVIDADTISVTGRREARMAGPGPALSLGEEGELAAKKISLRSEGAMLRLDQGAALKGSKVALGGTGSPPSSPGDGPAAKTKPFQLKVSDASLVAYADKRFELFAGGARREGSTDGEGVVSAEIPEEAELVQVTLWIDEYPEGRRRRYTVRIEELPAAAEVRGAKQRLKNLGYYDGKIDDEESPDLRAALLWLQRDHEIDSSGRIDAATTAALTRVHGH